jgi:hypothetical protein
MRPSILVLPLLAACAPADRLLATLDADPAWIDVSRDGKTVAYADRRGAETFLVVGDRRYGPFV